MWNLLSSPQYFLVVHERLSWAVEAQLDRDQPVYEYQFKRVFLDRPGMISANREVYSFALEGLEVCIPATDVGFMLGQLEKRFKQYGLNAIAGVNCHCLLLDDDQATQLEDQLRAKLPEARAVASLENRNLNAAILELESKNVLKTTLRDVPIEPADS